MELVENRLYRISPAIDKPELRKKAVQFKGYIKQPWDIRRAVVRLINPDGSLGDEWQVNPHYIISI